MEALQENRARSNNRALLLLFPFTEFFDVYLSNIRSRNVEQSEESISIS